MKASAYANTNIALIKYWGKRNPELNLPAVGSISVTLKDLFTRTTVRFCPDYSRDTLVLNGTEADSFRTSRVSKFLDFVRKKADIKEHAEVRSENNFPTGAGIASSASGFAALTLAATAAAGLRLNKTQLSVLARRGSGSAARSIFGGFVEMKVGDRADGEDSFAVQLADENHWPLQLFIAITSREEKQIGSTQGMIRTADTSPFYSQWVRSSNQDLLEMRTAIAEKDFEKLGHLTEQNCLRMHALAMSADPGMVYWNGITVDLIHAVREMRRDNLPAFFTIDAGPQVKVITESAYASRIETRLKEVEGIESLLNTSVGSDATLIEKGEY